MAFVNPNILAQIFGKQGAINSATPNQQQSMIQMLAGAGSGMTQAANQPGANFSQALGGGAQGMVQGQMQAQQMQMQQMQMQQAQAEMDRDARRQERISKILGMSSPTFASQVDARLPQVPQIGAATATPYQNAGQVSAQYESGGGGVGTVSTGRGDPGGPSYGTHQISSNAGTMTAFLESPEGQPFAQHFSGQQPGSDQFNQSYQEVVAGAGPQLEQAQRQFLQRTHVQPVLETAAKAGLPVDNPAVREALHSQAIQHSGGGNVQIINEAAARLGPNATPEDVVNALYEAREPYAVRALQEDGAAPDVIEGVRNRYRSERQQVLGLMGARNVGSMVGGVQGADAPVQNAGAPQLNGYQQRDAQRMAASPLAGLPPETQQIVAMLAETDPGAALKMIADARAPAEQPAAVREALFIAGGDTALARQIMAAGLNKDDMPVFMQQVEAIKEANPNITHQDAVNHVLNVTGTSVSPNTGRVTRTDNLRGVATEVPVQPGQDLPEPQAQGPSAWELVENTNVTGVGSGAIELGNRTLSQLGFNVGEDTVTARQYLRQMETDIVRAFQESPRFAEGERQQILQELNLGPNVLRDESTLRAGLRSSSSSLQSRLDRYARMAADTSLGETTRRDAAEKAAVIRSALDRIGVPVEQRYSRQEIVPGAGQAADDVNDLINRWAD